MKAIVVLSFPRSGTHFLIDFLRKNIAGFNPKLPIWASSEGLYYNLDRAAPGQAAWSRSVLDRERFIVKTHALPFDRSLQSHLDTITLGRETLVLTPFRSASAMLSSYARFTGFSGSLHDFLRHQDGYFGNGRSVADNLRTLLDYAMDRTVFVDIAAISAAPGRLAAKLADRIGASLLDPGERLPRRRGSHGKLGELRSRFSARESSEVVVAKASTATEWGETDVPATIREYFERARMCSFIGG